MGSEIPQGFPGGSLIKNLPANAGESDSIPGSGWSPGRGHGNPLQYSCLGNPMDREAWWATVHGVAESQIQLSTRAKNWDPAFLNSFWVKHTAGLLTTLWIAKSISINRHWFHVHITKSFTFQGSDGMCKVHGTAPVHRQAPYIMLTIIRMSYLV